MTSKLPKALALALLGSVPLACLNDENRCSPGQTYLDGICFGTPTGGTTAAGGSSSTGGTDSGGTGGTSLGGAAGDTGSGGSQMTEEPNLGTPCTDDTECKGGAYCDSFFSVCGGRCGPGDPFEAGCPAAHDCLTFGPDTVCVPQMM